MNSFFSIFLFLPVTLVVYMLLPRKAKPAVLFVASLVFYFALDAAHLPFVLGLAVLNYLGGIWIARASTPFAVRIVVAANLGLLILFKAPIPGFMRPIAANILNGVGLGSVGVQGVVRNIVTQLQVATQLTSPVGFSFLVFTGMSYALDIWDKKNDAETAFGRFVSFFLFFPKIVAGPITRYVDVHQDWWQSSINLERVAGGVRRFAIGLVKKVLIADVLGKYVTIIFAQPPETLGPAVAWIGIAFYTVQILYDFSGYSDMAIGIASVLGLKLPENFGTPYASMSVSEFWRNWHITLSSWFRDYVFYPLQWRFRRSRWRKVAQYTNVLVVFLLTGLWHGIAAHYAVWGMLHGGALAFEQTKAYRKIIKRVPGFVRYGYTATIVVLGWVFFRSPTLPYALRYLVALVPGGSTLARLPLSVMPPVATEAWLAFAVGIALSVFRVADRRLPSVAHSKGSGILAGVTGSLGILALFLLALVYMASGTVRPVLYGGF